MQSLSIIQTMTLLRRGVTALGLTLVIAAPGCGDEGLDPERRERMGDRIADAREAAGSEDAAGARRALVAFRREVREALAKGEISREDADRLLDGALQASRRVRAEITPEPTSTPSAVVAPSATPTAVAPSAPEPPPEPSADGNDEEKGKGKTQGKGQDKAKKKDKGKGGD
jgi:hypothetical protein